MVILTTQLGISKLESVWVMIQTLYPTDVQEAAIMKSRQSEPDFSMT